VSRRMGVGEPSRQLLPNKKLIFFSVLELNPELCACWAGTLPLSYISCNRPQSNTFYFFQRQSVKHQLFILYYLKVW
jgi:hypothetical protein